MQELEYVSRQPASTARVSYLAVFSALFGWAISPLTCASFAFITVWYEGWEERRSIPRLLDWGMDALGIALLLLPLILGTMAIRQINSSGGTLKGKWLAVSGIIASCLMMIPAIAGLLP